MLMSKVRILIILVFLTIPCCANNPVSTHDPQVTTIQGWLPNQIESSTYIISVPEIIDIVNVIIRYPHIEAWYMLCNENIHINIAKEEVKLIVDRGRYYKITYIAVSN